MALLELTTTSRVLAAAHCPELGLKVRVRIPKPPTAGLRVFPPLTPGPDQVPVTPFWVVFRGMLLVLPQSGPIGLRTTRFPRVIVTFKGGVVAHCPALGIKLSIRVPVLPILGSRVSWVTPMPDQVPEIPL